MRRWPGGGVGEAALSVGQEGRAMGHDSPNGVGGGGTQRSKGAR